MVYGWKSGARIAADAAKVGEELEAIRAESGKLNAEVVVESARDEGCELHKCFTWDDEKAAIAYRLDQARMVLRSIIIVAEPSEATKNVEFEVRAFEPVSTENGERVYIPTQEALSDESYRAEVIANIVSDIRALNVKLKAYREIVQDNAEVKQQLLELTVSV